MIQITKEQEQQIRELRETQKEMIAYHEQTKINENNFNIILRTVKKNELTIKEIEKLDSKRSIYVPLGRAFMKRDRDTTVKELASANETLKKAGKDVEEKYRLFKEKAQQKSSTLKIMTDKLKKSAQ